MKTDKQMMGIPKIAQLRFTGLLSVAASITASSVKMADKSGETVPVQAKGPTCSAVLLGDVNNDCTINILDAALVQSYARELRTNFASPVGKALSGKISSIKKDTFDVDKNGVVDYYDGRFLMNAIAGYTKLISSFVVQPPFLPNCDLNMTAVLKNTDQTFASSTRAFVVFTYADNALNSELSASGMQGTVSFTLASGVNRHGRVFEMAISSTGAFVFTGARPKLTKDNVGVSLVVVASTVLSGAKVSSCFVKPANLTGGKRAVSIATGISINIYDSFEPQKKVNFSSLNALCSGKTITKRLQLVFNSDFNLIVGKESRFISDFKAFFETKYRRATREIFLANVTVKAGSIVVSFDVTVTQAHESQFVSDVTNDVKKGLTFSFDANDMTTAQTLMVDGKERIPPPPAAKSSNKILIIVIVVVVVFCVLFIAIAVFLCNRKKHVGSKRIEVFRVNNFAKDFGNLPIQFLRLYLAKLCVKIYTITIYDHHAKGAKKHPIDLRCAWEILSGPVRTPDNWEGWLAAGCIRL